MSTKISQKQGSLQLKDENYRKARRGYNTLEIHKIGSHWISFKELELLFK